MNSPVSNLPAPSLPPGSEPASTPHVPEKPRRFPWRWLVLGALIAGGYWGWTLYKQNTEEARLLAKAPVRTAVVGPAKIERTIRLSGITAAEKFVTLITPQLRASRSGRNRDSATAVTATQSGSTSVAGAGSSSSSNSSSGSSGSSSGGSDADTVASSSSAVTGGSAAASSSSSNGFSAPSSTSAFKAATSRLSTAKSSSATSSRSTAASTSEALGTDGLGSTGSQLGQGMGGGGGGANEFTLVLQDLIKPGSYVKKGDVVAEFDRQFMLQRLEDYKSSVAQQEANLAKLRAELTMYQKAHAQVVSTAKAALDKAKLDMRTVPVLSAIDAEKTKLALDEAEAQYKQIQGEVKYVEISNKSQIRNAELELKASQLEFRRAEENADRMLSRATIGGMTVMQNTFRGSEFAQIQAGDQLYPGQFFMQVVDTSGMVINANLNQVDAERLRIGSKASVRFDAYPDLTLPAHIVAIAAVTRTGGFRASFVKDIPVRLKLDAMDPRVIPDLSVSADVVLASEETAAAVPLSAVFKDSTDTKPYVLIREGNVWRRREVELGLTSFVSAAVRSGLKDGEVVAAEKPDDAPKAEPQKT